MANRMKEEEKNEKIIRGLLKLPANKRCINCNNLGPQYVCTNFWTFICTNCSGVHREFTHRVKSVSMAKFTSQEVAALQEGGNERAREIFFKEWDPQRSQFPDSSNIDRLRDFIKHVYQERRFSGDRRSSKPKTDSEITSDSRRPDSYRGTSRSPPYNERYNESPGYNSRNTPNERNPRYSYGERSPGDYRRSPQQRVDERRVPEGTKPQGGSPNYQGDTRSSPPVRPVRDILGDDAPPLRVGELPKPNGKPNGTKVVVNPLPPPQVERTSSSASSIGSGQGESTSVQQPSTQPTVQPAPQPKKEEPPAIVSLIDFSEDLEPPNSSQPASQPQAHTQPSMPQQNNSPQANTNSNDWSTFDAFGAQKAVPSVATNANPLDSSLSHLSLSGSPVVPPSLADPSPTPANGVQMSTTQPSPFNAPSLVGASGNQQQFGVPGVPSNQPQSFAQLSIPTNNAQPPLENPAPSDNKPSARKALPEDFFTSLYPPAAAPMQGWPRGPQFGMGYGMQYPASMVMPNYPQPQPQPQPMKSVNPFDIGNDPAPAQASAFPSMGPGLMQGAPPNMNSLPQQPLMQTSSFENTSPRWMAPQQMPYAAVPPSQYMMQQVPGSIPQQMPSNMMPMMQQGSLGQVNTGSSPFGASFSDPNLAGRYSQPSTPNNSFGTVGGNPFG
ncbi:ARF GAP-like zinc finger-containing protein ZIGA4 [Rhynchospora pubera]|uniref:ARF GAP-like zinc finger-containing protein ZIGA4 n=1 Tax=Rhynchospora pubera TaxID=906938 RepID=A0AAV8GTY1_9POAL|nr:ARF GAP-like zinc finger-containing protein ZIGA4 [Rhynchospora pubera]